MGLADEEVEAFFLDIFQQVDQLLPPFFGFFTAPAFRVEAAAQNPISVAPLF